MQKYQIITYLSLIKIVLFMEISVYLLRSVSSHKQVNVSDCIIHLSKTVYT